MEIDIPAIIDLLIQSTPEISATALLQKCLDIGMTAQPYRALPQDDYLPAFDTGYDFSFETKGSSVAGFDVLEKDGLILQAGFQICYYRGLFGSKSKRYYQAVVNCVEQRYGPGVPIKAKRIVTLNYSDPQTICYISKIKAFGKDVVTLRVGNRFFWG